MARNVTVWGGAFKKNDMSAFFVRFQQYLQGATLPVLGINPRNSLLNSCNR